MRRGSAVVLLVALVLVPLLAFQAGAPVAQAQDASPAAGQDTGTPSPVHSRSVAGGSLEVLTPGTANLVLGRLVLAPGGAVTFAGKDPSASLVYVQTGALTFNVTVPLTVARGAGRGTPSAGQPEMVAANTEFTLNEDDSALFPPALQGEVRNDGTDDAAAWVVSVAIRPAGTPTAATPTS
jgi:hypothetical protein